MARNFKALGAALAAVAVLSGVAASPATAQLGWLTSDGPVTLTGVHRPGSAELANSLTAFGGHIKCPGSTYTGHKSEAITELVPSKADKVTVTPHFTNCKDQLGTAITVHMNGCHFELYDPRTKGGVEHTYLITLRIVCPDKAVIELTGNPCKYAIKPQPILTGGHIKTTPNPQDDLDLEGAFGGIHVESPNCGLTTTSGQLHVDITIGGHNGEGKATPVTVTD